MDTKVALDAVMIAGALQEQDAEMFREDLKRWPVRSNRATLLSHPCEAFVYYSRTAWADFPLMEIEQAQRMKVGVEREPYIRARVEKVAERLGAEIVGTKVPYEDAARQISGEVDWLLRFKEENKFGYPRGTKLIMEAKTVSPYLWDSCVSIDALKADRWTGKYWGQVQLYLLTAGIENGVFALENLNGQIRYLGFTLDYEYAESLLKKADRINTAIELKEPPAKLSKPEICRDCPALALCCPPLQYGASAEFADEAALVSALAMREKLHERLEMTSADQKQFDAVDKDVKTTIKEALKKSGAPSLIVGDWICNAKEQKNGTRVMIERLGS